MDIAKRIREIREVKGLRQVEVANSLNLDPSYYARLEKRGSKMSVDQLSGIAEALGVEISDLLRADDFSFLPNESSQSIGEHAIEMYRLCVEHTEDCYEVFQSWVMDTYEVDFATLVSNGNFDELVDKLNNQKFRLLFCALLGYVQFVPPWFGDKHRELFKKLAPYSGTERLLLWPFRQQKEGVKKL